MKSYLFILAGVEGIEPSSKVLETPILPMNYTPKHINNYTEIDFFVNVFVLKYLFNLGFSDIIILYGRKTI